MRSRRRLGFLIALILGAAAVGALAPASASARARGNVRVLALIPTPGFPAFPLVIGHHIFEGTYDNPTGDHVPSRVFEYSGGGELLESWSVQGQNLNQP